MSKIKKLSSSIENFYYEYLYGDWESMRHWLWIYGHSMIFASMFLAGFFIAKGNYVIGISLIPFSLIYLYKRHEKAREYKVHSDTPVEPEDVETYCEKLK